MGDINFIEFLPFLVLFLSLISLLKYYPGKPWIILIAFVGMIYGFLAAKAFPDYKPTLLADAYPAMKDAALWDFSYLKSDKLTASAVLVGSIKVAFVAVLETLISARIADGLTGTRFNQHQEVLGMSFANILAGVMGGTPCTGVLVRTSVNVKSGATDKISQFINAIAVLIVVIVAMPAFVYTPLPCIAAILVTSSCRLVPISVMK